MGTAMGMVMDTVRMIMATTINQQPSRRMAKWPHIAMPKLPSPPCQGGVGGVVPSLPKGCLGGLRGFVAVAAFAVAFSLAEMSMAMEPVINEWCPVMRDEKADPEIVVVYKGRTIAFCCDICVSKFLGNPQKYVVRLPPLPGASVSPPQGGHAAGAQDIDETKGNGGTTPPSPPWQGGVEQEAREPLLGRLHPVLVHFPLAGMPLALLGFAVWMVTGNGAFGRADVPPLIVATLASIAAVITGRIAHETMRFSATLEQIAERHEFFSITVMVLAICLSLVRIWRWNRLEGWWRWLYGGGLAVTSAFLAFTGYLGGSLVFGTNHLRW